MKRKYVFKKDRESKNLTAITSHIPYMDKLKLQTEAEKEGISLYKLIQIILENHAQGLADIERPEDLLG